MSVRQVQ